MKINAKKTCDVCGKIVATKHGLFWWTDEKYITARTDDYAPGYTDKTTIKSNVHLCNDCWFRMRNAIRREAKEG